MRWRRRSPAARSYVPRTPRPSYHTARADDDAMTDCGLANARDHRADEVRPEDGKTHGAGQRRRGRRFSSFRTLPPAPSPCEEGEARSGVRVKHKFTAH